MIRGLYISTAGMDVQQARLNSLTQNLANVNTSGYKKQTVTLQNFAELILINEKVEMGGASIPDKPPLGYYCLGPMVGEIYRDFSPGAAGETNKSTDIMLSGEGFFVAQTPAGERYTRNGSFCLDSEGYLVTSKGDRVLGVSGPVHVGGEDFTVTKDGRVIVNNEEVDAFRVVTFTNPQMLLPEENSYYSSPAGIEPQNATGPQIYQGFLEQANVELSLEMVNLIEIFRTYEANQRLVQMQDDLLEKAVNQIGNVK